MKKSITPFLIFSITAGFALSLSFAAFAADDNPNNQKKAASAKAPAPAARSVGHAPVAKAPAAPVHAAQVQRPVANKSVNTAATHAGANPALSKRVAASKSVVAPVSKAPAVQVRGARTAGTNANTSRTQTATARTGANGGGQYTRTNNYGGRWTAGNNHPGWNQGQVNNWNGHQYRWFDGGWLMVDGGFWPVPGYQGGGSLMAGAQQQLAADGYYNGPIDGIAGPGTRQAIASYQNANNLPVTGHLNIPTQQSLGLD